MKILCIIITLNEEKHIERCVRNVGGLVDRVIVVDSGSTDRTVEIARLAGAEVVQHTFFSHADQYNWALSKYEEQGDWIFRLDADEVVSGAAVLDLRLKLAKMRPEIAGILVTRRIHFMGRELRHGGMGNLRQLRLWRAGRGRFEKRSMDEHVLVDGVVVQSDIVIEDINLNGIGAWIDKHNRYSSRELIDIMAVSRGPSTQMLLPAPIRFVRMLKIGVYGRAPRLLRAWLLFIFRLVVLGGFLDGRAGVYFHFFQSLWYRSLVDAKYEELNRILAAGGGDVVSALSEVTGVSKDILNRDAA